MLSLREVLANRREKITELAEFGYSAENIARYFEISPALVQSTLEKMGVFLHEIDSVNTEENINELLKNRDEMLCDIEDNDRDSLAKYGFYFKPKTHSQTEEIYEKVYGKESDLPEYVMLFDGEPLWKIRNTLNYRTRTKVIETLEHHGFTGGKVVTRGRKYRENKNMAVMMELSADGFLIEDIVRYTNASNASTVMRASAMAKEHGLKKTSCRENVEELLKEGYLQKDIAELLGCSLPFTTAVRKNVNQKWPNFKVREYNRHESKKNEDIDELEL